MHASDRYLKFGTIEDLRKEEGGAVGYAKRLSHGEIGKGLNNYDAIFTELKRVGFDAVWPERLQQRYAARRCGQLY